MHNTTQGNITNAKQTHKHRTHACHLWVLPGSRLHLLHSHSSVGGCSLCCRGNCLLQQVQVVEHLVEGLEVGVADPPPLPPHHLAAEYN